ncbi:hypothetical protein XBJ2_2690004 [Xenorhabdus bovienii str. Jollieti]|nr:hypothetical protein XBJ2_2690004 [Xenorhabdus bovienii str. Jollieti]
MTSESITEIITFNKKGVTVKTATLQSCLNFFKHHNSVQIVIQHLINYCLFFAPLSGNLTTSDKPA